MPLTKSCSAKAKSKNIGELIQAGHPKKQSVAIAYSVCRDLQRHKKNKNEKKKEVS